MKRIKGYIGIARKAGYAIIGGEKISSHTQKLYLILVDQNAGKSLMREMDFVAENRNIPILKCDEMEELVGIENCKAVAFKNKALSEMIIKILKGE